MDDNFNNSSMAGKVVSVLIALLFIVVLAFPIANSLGNTDNGGGSGESEKVVLNTFESISGVDLAPYKSYQLYNSSTTPILPHEITYTLEDLIELQNQLGPQLSQASDESDIELILLQVVDETDNGIAIGIYADEIGITIPFSVSSGGPYYSINDITSFELTLTTDYVLDCSLDNTESVHTTATQVIELSESEDGWIDVFPNAPKITVGSELMIYGFVYDENNHLERVLSDTTVLTEDMFSENHLRFTVEFGEGYTTYVDLELQPTDKEGVFTGGVFDWDGLINKDGNIYSPDYAYSDILYVSTYGYTQSGSDSGTSVDGIAGTLIKLVPILMIIGLLMMFIIPMVYKPN